MNSSQTLGPDKGEWLYEKVIRYGFTEYEVGYCEYCGDGNSPVSRTVAEGIESEEDARLISASKELLAAAKEALEVMSSATGPAQQKLRAAITKATGKA